VMSAQHVSYAFSLSSELQECVPCSYAKWQPMTSVTLTLPCYANHGTLNRKLNQSGGHEPQRFMELNDAHALQLVNQDQWLFWVKNRSID